MRKKERKKSRDFRVICVSSKFQVLKFATRVWLESSHVTRVPHLWFVVSFSPRVSKWLNSKNEHFSHAESSVPNYWTDIYHHSPGWRISSLPLSCCSGLPYDRSHLSGEHHSEWFIWYWTERSPQEGMIWMWFLKKQMASTPVLEASSCLCCHYALWSWSSNQGWAGASSGKLSLSKTLNPKLLPPLQKIYFNL